MEQNLFEWQKIEENLSELQKIEYIFLIQRKLNKGLSNRKLNKLFLSNRKLNEILRATENLTKISYKQKILISEIILSCIICAVFPFFEPEKYPNPKNDMIFQVSK